MHNAEEGTLEAVTALNPHWVEELKDSYQGDDWAKEMLELHRQKSDLPDGILVHCGVIRKHNRIYVGRHGDWRAKMVMVLHSSATGGHSGILGTYQRVKKLLTWPKLKDEVVKQVQQCDICQLNKEEHLSSPGLLEPISIPNGA
jgi:Integrase zinc binding domain